MRKTRIALVSAALASMVVSAAAHAAARTARVHYAEPVTLKGLPSLPAAGVQKPAGPARTGFDAFGRRFELALESNDRVIRKLSSADRGRLPAHALYSGTVAGLPGSWVRLTRLDDGIHGLVFDGTELYVLAPAGQAQAQLDTPLPGLAKTATVIYRAADADSGLGPDFCRVLQPPAGDVHAEPAYKAIFAELKANAPVIEAALATKELDLALIGDTQLAAAYANAPGEMLARLNNIDGIFSGQVGVRVTSGFVKMLTSDAGMTATVADQLLDQLESYRRATPEAASRGVAHLMTGRELDGSTVGIAYMGTLCAPQFAVSLSQTYSDSFTSSLVAAHELGHNFGAPHDGASGSACATTPQTYLMAPTVNGSNVFSQCSLDQIAPVVRAAGCLMAPSISDVAVEFASTSLSGYTDVDVHVPVDVVSKGNVAADQVVLTLTANGNLFIQGGTVTGGTCTLQVRQLTCQLGSLSPGETRQADVVFKGRYLDTAGLLANVSASRDDDPTNNDDSVSVTFASPADGAVAVSASSSTAYVGQTHAFHVTVTNAGPLALEDAMVVIDQPYFFTTLATSGAGADCRASTFSTTCTLGSLPAGASRRIDVSTTGTRPSSETLSVSVQSSSDKINGNDTVYFTITALPTVELAVTAEPGPSTIQLGGTATQSFTLRSVGTQPVAGAAVNVQSPSGGIAITSVSGTGAQCVPDASMPDLMLRCTYSAPIEAGGYRRLDVQLRGTGAGSATLVAIDATPDSQHLPGSAAGMAAVAYDVKSQADVGLSTLSFVSTYDHRPTTLIFDVASSGAGAAPNSVFSLSLPASIRAASAQSTLGTCVTTPSAVNCTFGTLATGSHATARVVVVGDVTGPYALAAHVTADSDANDSNGSALVTVDVRPNVDLSLGTLPAGQHVRQGGTIEYAITVAAATQPVQGALTAITVGNGLTAIQATPSQGTCASNAGSFSCALGTLPANSSATVTVTLRGDTPGSHQFSISSTAPGDIDLSNGWGTGTVVVDQRGNVAVQSASASVAAAPGMAFDLPRISISAVTATDDVRIAMTIPSSFSTDSATADNGPCAVNAGNISCSFGTLAAGETRGIVVRLRPLQSGTFSVTATATATDDSDTSNNSGSVSITVTKAASSGGGGGGGGALDRGSLLVLLLLAPAVARRRRTGAD